MLHGRPTLLPPLSLLSIHPIRSSSIFNFPDNQTGSDPPFYFSHHRYEIIQTLGFLFPFSIPVSEFQVLYV
ncbi:hypothetical protein DVH24_039059 [Malus domestica]|uniref:Uncharacterized protein n=1 Tax=Malus domestica TaxID=3750 RepID=A0A498KG99_MALDO|nr:hypothetical protein DVH24_039059 [Malus domestica]